MINKFLYIKELLRLVLNKANINKTDSLSCLHDKVSLSFSGVIFEMCWVILYLLVVRSSIPVNVLRSFGRLREKLENKQNLFSLVYLICEKENSITRKGKNK